MKHSLGSLILFCSILTGCSTPEVLQHYPSRQLDRPYTLDKGLNSWKTISAYSFANERGRSPSNSLLSFPWLWEQSLEDNLSLLWAPLPTELKVQLARNSEFWMGLSFNLLGSPIYQFQEFNLTPILTFESQYKLSNHLAVKGSFSSQLELRRAENPWHGIILLKPSLVIQLLPIWYIEPYLQFQMEFGNPRTGYLPFYPSPSAAAPETPTEASPHLRLPLGLKTAVLVMQQLEIGAEYRYFGLLYSNQYSSHQFFLTTTYFF